MNLCIRLILLMCLSFFAFGSAVAIDKAAKVDKTPKVTVPVTDTAGQLKKNKSTDLNKGGQPQAPKSYDKFIDLNNNGIDDRLEKGQGTPKQQPKADSSKTDTSPTKP